MSFETRVEPQSGKLPSVSWRWDAETDILSGSFRTGTKSQGLTGSVELTDEEGAVVVLDVADGLIRGLDVVVWPEVTTVADLAEPQPARSGRVVVASGSPRPGVTSLEVHTALSVSTNRAESAFHLRLGAKRPVEVVKAAEHFLIELDQKSRLAGFWLTEVPPFPSEEES